MKILIIEDEPVSALRLARLLKEIVPDAEIEVPVTSIAECIKYFDEGEKPDLIFSDIRIADGLSFEGLLHAPDSVPVIFTSAYEEYALKAFEANGIGYIMKPVTGKAIAEAIEKCEDYYMLPTKISSKTCCLLMIYCPVNIKTVFWFTARILLYLWQLKTFCFSQPTATKLSCIALVPENSRLTVLSTIWKTDSTRNASSAHPETR